MDAKYTIISSLSIAPGKSILLARMQIGTSGDSFITTDFKVSNDSGNLSALLASTTQKIP
jgi:hypothetical protein